MTRKTEGGSAVPVFVVGGSGILTPEQSDWIDTASTDNPNPEQWVTADAKILSKSSEYTVQNADNAKIIECNGTFSIIFPDVLDVGFQVVIVNVGSGTITLSATTTLQAEATTLPNQYTGATVYHRGSNVWLAMGRLA